MADSAIAEAVRRARQGDIYLQQQITAMYQAAIEAIALEQLKFARYVSDQIAKGAPVSPSWINRDARYLSLQSRLYAALHQFGDDAMTFLSNTATGQVAGALAQSRAEAEEVATSRTGVIPPGFGPETWAIINRYAIQAASAIISDLDSPLRQLLARDLPESALAEFRKQWGNGLLLGKNPNTIARNLKRRIDQLTLSRAQLIARTEFHRAYREGKREQFTRSDVITGWTWRAALDRRTCPVCWAMHGTIHRTDEILDGHPNCRCVMIPISSPRTDTTANLEPGEARFGRLPPDQQLRILGPTRFKLYNEGRTLQSFVGQKQNRLWGPMRTLEPVRMRGLT